MEKKMKMIQYFNEPALSCSLWDRIGHTKLRWQILICYLFSAEGLMQAMVCVCGWIMLKLDRHNKNEEKYK